MVRYSLVIGALNEAKRLPKTLDTLHRFLNTHNLLDSTELVIVAAKGRDNTAEIAAAKLVKFTYSQLITPGAPVGKGRDIQLGMLKSKGRIRVYMDADLATPLKHLLDVFEILSNKDADIVIGTRDIKKMHTQKSRRMISVLGNICFAAISGFYLPDTQCGFKGFTKNSAEICFCKMTRMQWSFDMEVLLIGRLHQLVIAQLPINDWQDVEGGTFKSSFKQTLVFGKDMVDLFINRLRGRYT
jgi:dolichyl-phosphate beta-glucosyltransferase